MKLTSCFLLLLVMLGCHEKDTDLQCNERPRDSSACYTNYDPVCGCNKKTYSNDCEARAYGITNFTMGACEKNK